MFEVTYFYYDKTGDDYDKSETKKMVKKVGTPYEDVPVEKLAQLIMSQLARRDIFVVDVEIYEFAKHKVSFKETKGGILIKNKKFMLDGTVEAVDEVQLVKEEVSKPRPQEQVSLQQLRWEIYDPDPNIIGMLKYNLTPKKRYPILKEELIPQKTNISGVLTDMPSYGYIVTDDAGRKCKVPSIHFVPEQIGLIGMENQPIQIRQPKLTHMDEGISGMPVLRRG